MAIRGVNLGGWLVLERWITPSLFKGTDATDEFTLMQALGDRGQDILSEHHRSFISEPDFAWLAAHGIEAVRIPVGYWIFGGEAPYIKGIEHLDSAFHWAAAHHLKVVIDLHAAPGSQNGWDHSGRSGDMGWHKDSAHQQKSLDVLEKLAERYGRNPQLYGIEVLNEPHWEIPKKTLAKFYEDAYKIIRKHAPDSVAVIISDAFRPYDWGDVLASPLFTNVMLDRHFYQCFDDNDKALDIPGHVHKAEKQWCEDVDALQTLKPVIAGEWSLALDGEVTPEERAIYAKAELAAMDRTTAWFFWTYKTEESPEWDLRRSAILLGLKPE